MPLIPQGPRLPGGALLAKLHAIQREHGCLSPEMLRRAAEELGAPLSQVFSAAVFYAAFSFQPRGRHTIHVCLGTACHIRGGERLIERLEADLGVKTGETTEDGGFTLETVHCVGSCSISPVVRIDHVTLGRMRTDRLSRLLTGYRGKEQEQLKETGRER